MFEHFQAGYQHTVEERERKRREILQSPATGPGWGEIDLDSGVVTITGQAARGGDESAASQV